MNFWLGLLIGIVVGVGGTLGAIRFVLTDIGFYILEWTRNTLWTLVGWHKVIISQEIQQDCNVQDIRKVLQLHMKNGLRRSMNYWVDDKHYVTVSHKRNGSRTFVRLFEERQQQAA